MTTGYVAGVPVSIDGIVVGRAVVNSDGVVNIKLGDEKIAENIIYFFAVGSMRGLSLAFEVETATQQSPFHGNTPRY